MNVDRRGTSAGPRQRKRKPAKKRALVELVPIARSVNVVTAGRYVLEVAGARVEFGDDVSVATLRRVLEALRSC